jgi:hypothetical protein
VFYTPINNVAGLQLASPRSAGGTSLVLLPGQGGRVTALPTRVTVVTAGSYGTSAEVLTIFGVTGVSGDTLTISGPLEGTTDRGYAAGDYADLRVTAGYVNDLNAAVDGVLNPYQAPAFTAFAISGQATTLEVGSTIAAGSKTFTWATSNSGNVAVNGISIIDSTTSTVLGTGLANTGLTAITIGAITSNVPAIHTWSISGQDVQNTTFSTNFSVNWFWRVYAGVSTNPTVVSSDIIGFAVSNLQATVGGTYALAAGGYKYFCVPTTFVQPTSFKDQATGFNVPMADATANAAYSNTNASGINYAIVSVTNSLVVATNYAVYRSYNQLGSTLNLVVA